jgi:hypothetical protein
MRRRFWSALAATLTITIVCACSSNNATGPDTGTTTDPPPLPVTPHEREIRGGRLHDAVISGFTEATSTDPARLAGIAQAELRGRLGAIQPGDFVEIHRNVSALRGGARLQFVTLRQTIGGVPIDDTYLHIGVRYDANGARLVSSSYRLFESIPVDAKAALPHDRAIALAQEGLRLRSPVGPSSDRLVVHDLGGRLQLAWSFAFPGSYRQAYVIASGVEQGRVYSIDQRVYATNGTVTGPVVHGGAPGGLGMVQTHPLANSQVAGGGASANANGDGVYTITVPNGTLLTATLNGRASNVLDQAGSPISATGSAVDGGVTDLAMTSTAEGGLAQVTSYFFVDQVRSFLEANGMDPALFGAPLQTRTNLNDTCNAFYDPFARNINFFKSGGGCNNSSIDTVIAHEYGHFVDDFNGGIINGGLSEGWGDLLACLFSKQSVVGFDLFPGQAIRDCKNTYHFPPGGNDEVHNLGQAWAGYGWDARENLIAALGPMGDDLARALILPSFQSNAPDIPTAVRETFLRDDDDGDLMNHTPHWDQLFPAAVNHALSFAVETDDIPPAPVSDLAITNVKPTQITVTWTASGDDGTMGTATFYQLRWSTAPIDATNFGSATLVATADPKPSGSAESINVIVPPESPVFVALIVLDEQFNASTLSNVPTATTPAGTPVFSEGYEGNVANWTATGLWHVTTKAASEGTHSFWYGQEATGNYNTGAANSGDLTSPIIDLTAVSAPVLIYDQRIAVEPDPFDIAQLIITDANDPTHTVTLAKDKSFTNALFVPRVVPLTGFDSKKITLRFHFDTIDSIANNTEGWFLDHLRIVGSETCAHSLCTTGGPLDPTCSTCVASVCAFDSFCCAVAWDSICVNEAKATCGITCPVCGNGTCEPGETPANCPQDCTPPCAHDVCDPGVPLEPACDTCATNVCATDPFCCTVFWDRICVQEAETVCGKVCQGCAHDFCAVGGPLANNCDTCATNVCNADPFCCTTGWDSRCVQEAADTCMLTCAVCSHSLCNQGTPLESSCDPCVTAVCAADPYCCNNTWDQRCIDESVTTCGLQCAIERSAISQPGERRRSER